MSKKILISLSVIGVVAAIVIGATTAFFSDTETSTGNTFTAGAIDLKIDNESYAIDYTIPGYNSPTGALVRSDNTSWTLDDLTSQVFFKFIDLKPGDIGEDTISIHVNNNDAWACLTIDMTENSDGTCTEPELEEEDDDCVEYDVGDDNTHFNGELAENLQIAVWHDDGDNVFEQGERLLQLGGFGENPIVTIQELAGLSDGGPAGVLTLADHGYSVFTDDNSGKPLVGGNEYYLAKAWCFGDLEESPVNNNSDYGPLGEDQQPEGDGVNADRGTGFNCSGAGVNNASQTDRVMGNITFYAVQARNNDRFSCSTLGAI